MNFPPPDPSRFLLDHLPDHFRRLSSDDFGAMIRYLFEKDDYRVKPVVSSADLGYHMWAQKEEASLVILPVHQSSDHVVGDDMVRKAVLARSLYQAEQVWVVTNATFSPEAEVLAEESDIELWDWSTLYDGICEMFFDGQDILAVQSAAAAPMIQPEPDAVELKLKVRWQPVEGLERDWYNLQLLISNPTMRNMYVHLELPAFIDLKTNQVFADQWGRDDFVAGMIYAGASVRTNAQFRTSRLGDRPPGGTIALTYHERRETPVTFHINARVKGEACYLITYCYTNESAEYAGMVSFRDEKLRAGPLGRWSIDVYYRLSPYLIAWSDRNRMLRFMVRFLVRTFVPRFLNLYQPGWKNL